MSPWGKFFTGLGATALLAGVAHGPLGFGQNFITMTGTASAQALTGAGYDQIAVQMQEAPALQRVALLSGPVSDPAERAKALAAVKAVPGVFDARWVDEAGQVATSAQAAAAPVATAAAAPQPAAVVNCQAQVDSAIQGKTIEFATGSTAISATSDPLLDALATQIKDCSGVQLEVAGHTDATGGAAANQRLSQGRADAVVSALVERGVATDKLKGYGYGSAKPVLPGTSGEANARNRRIEFTASAV
jgi:OmpA-OmpF porin, OOP family